MKTLTLYGPGNLDYCDSYGLIGCQLARHLSSLGVYVNVLALGKREHDSQPADVRTVVQQPIRATFGGIALGYPTGYHNYNQLLNLGPRVALTMFESTRLPTGWADVLNIYDAVITPSQFCRDVFVDCGITAPVHVIPLGVSETYQYAKRSGDRPLTFLAFLDRGKRKGGLVALNAFVAAFGDNPNCRLILKSRRPRQGMEILNPNVEIVQADMSEEELYKLYLKADVLINPHLGEGFGLIPREFAATGGVSLTTAWSGTADNLSEWGFPLGYRLVKADWSSNAKLANQDLGDWAEPNFEGLVAALRRVADNRDWYSARARVYAANVARLYTWEGFAKNVLAVWEEVADGDFSSRQIAS